MSPFRLIILAIFILFAAVGFAIFAGVGDFFGSKKGANVPIQIWGTIDHRVMKVLLEDIRDTHKNFDFVSYVEKDPRTFESEFVEVLATGRGPDLMLLPHDLIVPHQNKLVIIPYDTFSERSFKDTFIEEGELFLTQNGILGLPFRVDPLVMYWNRALFADNGIASPPLFWDEFFLLAPRLTKRDQASNILKSFVSLGEYGNVLNGKAILSALIMQTGNPIVAQGNQGRFSTLSGGSGNAEAALRFYTEFSNPVKSTYSWNRALPQSRTMFLAGDLALYFGFASELSELRAANPNLNFDVASFPQSRESGTKRTFGNLSAFVIPRTSTVPNAAFSAALVLTGAPALEMLATHTGLPPVRRDLLSRPPTDAYRTIFYASALQADAWLDPNRNETDRVFRAMVEGVTSGRADLRSAIQTAHAELENLLK